MISMQPASCRARAPPNYGAMGTAAAASPLPGWKSVGTPHGELRPRTLLVHSLQTSRTANQLAKLALVLAAVLGSVAILLSLIGRQHRGFRASIEASPPSMPLSAKQSDLGKKVLADLTVRVANTLIAKAQTQGQESGACSVLGDLGLSSDSTTSCSTEIPKDCGSGGFAPICKVMQKLHTKEVSAHVQSTSKSVKLIVTPDRADFAMCLKKNPTQCEGSYKIFELAMTQLSFKANAKPSLNITATGDIRTLNGAVRIERQQLRLVMDTGGVTLKAVEGTNAISPLASWVSPLKIIHMFRPELMGEFSVVPPSIKGFGVKAGLCIGSEYNCKHAVLDSVVRFGTSIEMAGSVRTGLLPTFTLVLVNTMNVSRVLRALLPKKIGTVLSRLVGPVGAIGLDRGAKGVIKWNVDQKYFEASFQGAPTGLDGACDKRKPFASVIGCLFKLTKKDRPKPFRITFDSRTRALDVEQLTTSRRQLAEGSTLQIKVTESVIINRLSVFIKYEGGLGQSIRAGARLGLAICTSDEPCASNQKVGQIFFLGQGSVVYDVATTTAALGVKLAMQGWWWKIGFKGMLRGLVPKLPTPRIPFLHVGDATVTADVGFNLAAAAVGGVVPLLRTFALEASMCLGHVCDCARVTKQDGGLSECASGTNTATKDTDGHVQSHDYVLGSAALSLSFTNPDQISFAAYVQKLSLGTTLKAMGVQTQGGQYKSLYQLVEPVVPQSLLSEKNGFSEATISYSLLGTAVGAAVIPAGFSFSGGMSLQIGDAYMHGHATVAVGLGSLLVAAQLPKLELGNQFRLCKREGCTDNFGPTFYLQIGKTLTDPKTMGSDNCKKDDLFCLEMVGYVEIPALKVIASSKIMVGRSGFHLSAKTAFGIGIQFDTTVDWGFDLKKAGFDFKASVQGDYVKVLTERMFAAFQSNPGLSDDEINEGGGFMKGLLSSTMEHMLEGVLDTVKGIFSISKVKMEGHASLTGLKASCEIDYQATGETRILKFGFDVGKAGDIGVELMKSMGEKVKSLMASLFKEWVEKQKRDRALFQSKMKANGDKLKAAARAAYEKRQANKKARRDAMKEAFRGRGLQATPTSSPTANPVATPTDGYGYGYGSLEDLLNSLMKAAANCTVNCSNFSMNSSAFNFSTAAGYGDDISAPDNNANALAVLRSIYGADYNSSAPTQNPTSSPTTGSPTAAPSASPTSSPSTAPSANPTSSPTTSPTSSPSTAPTANPTSSPTTSPTSNPTASPTTNPTAPSEAPTTNPTASPTASPTHAPTWHPTVSPTGNPTTGMQKLSRNLEQDLSDTYFVWGPIRWAVLAAFFVLGLVYFHSAYGGFWGIRVYVEVTATGNIVNLRVSKRITVGTLKAKILRTSLLREKGEQYTWPQEQVLTKGTLTLKDSIALADYDIKHGDKLVLETEQSKLDDYGSTGNTMPRHISEPEPAPALGPATPRGAWAARALLN